MIFQSSVLVLGKESPKGLIFGLLFWQPVPSRDVSVIGRPFSHETGKGVAGFGFIGGLY